MQYAFGQIELLLAFILNFLKMFCFGEFAQPVFIFCGPLKCIKDENIFMKIEDKPVLNG
jgi:hypothetical protein